MKRQILNLVYNVLITIGIVIMVGIPISSGKNIFRMLDEVKFHYVPVVWLLYFSLLLASLWFDVLSFMANEMKKENSATQKSLAFFTVAAFLLLGFGPIMDRKFAFAVPFFICLIAIMVYRCVSGKEK